jgi:hypothetical protein
VTALYTENYKTIKKLEDTEIGRYPVYGLEELKLSHCPYYSKQSGSVEFSKDIFTKIEKNIKFT